MPADYRTVRLMKNRLYPTYQLHAVMAARKTTPEDGLKIGVLTILDWLRHRLGPDAPETLTAPQPERYADFSWENLRSLYINQGYVIDIVSLPEQGAWTMQIVEPDLGSDPGNPEQRRQAVPGRVIESNIAFTISNGELHCGFRTMISDPEDTEELCEVYRPAFIRLLADNPRFGLRQIAPLTPSVTRVETMEQLRQLASLQKNPASHMPLILFTQTLEEREIAPHDVPPDLRIGISPFLVKLPDLPKRMALSELKQPVDPAFDLVLTACALAWRSRLTARTLARTVLLGWAGAMVLIGAVALWAAVDFNSLFVLLHRLLFSNELWLMDPQTDLIILLMPESFFVLLSAQLGWLMLRFFWPLGLILAALLYISFKPMKSGEPT